MVVGLLMRLDPITAVKFLLKVRTTLHLTLPRITPVKRLLFIGLVSIKLELFLGPSVLKTGCVSLKLFRSLLITSVQLWLTFYMLLEML